MLLLLFGIPFLFGFVSEHSFPKPLSAEEEKDCLTRFAQGTEEEKQEAKEKLILHNLRLVAHIAKKYRQQASDMEDMISIGTVGLIKAIVTYDAKKSIRLATYASRCIENAILSQMRVWFQISTPRAEKNQNGVFCHRFPRIFTSFVPLQTAM